MENESTFIEDQLRDPVAEAATAHFDVIIVGAGISGVAAAYRLSTRCPGTRFAILEARSAIGGTWDLFRFPGIRSDSVMYTLGFPFRPWREERAIADGAAIRRYVEDTARQFGIDRHIRFGHRVIRADWSSSEVRWTLDVETAPDGRRQRFTCSFLHLCSGYYDYAQGYMPDFPGVERFSGPVVHPQHWPESLDYAGKRIVVIGSGATAVTMVPALAETAGHVTMLQRSPSYIVSRPARAAAAGWMRRRLTQGLADTFARWLDVVVSSFTYTLARRLPGVVRRSILSDIRNRLGPGWEVEKDFSPRYNPWDQRVCLVPDGDLFAAMKAGKASVVTDSIDSFTERGLRLASGKEIEADIVVSATGLVVKMAGGMAVLVDDKPVKFTEQIVYKGMMLSGVPNLALSFGYINASWTLRADLIARAVCRLLNHMKRRGFAVCTPVRGDRSAPTAPLLDFTSGYVRRADSILPRQGTRRPWRVRQNYILDMLGMSVGPVEDGVLEFVKGRVR